MSRRRARTSVLLNNSWDENASFSISLDLADCGRAELLEALKTTSVRGGCRGRMMLNADQLRARCAKLGMTNVKLSGLQALRYRAGVVVQYLARLECCVGPELLEGVPLPRPSASASTSASDRRADGRAFDSGGPEPVLMSRGLARLLRRW